MARPREYSTEEMFLSIMEAIRSGLMLTEELASHQLGCHRTTLNRRMKRSKALRLVYETLREYSSYNYIFLHGGMRRCALNWLNEKDHLGNARKVFHRRLNKEELRTILTNG